MSIVFGSAEAAVELRRIQHADELAALVVRLWEARYGVEHWKAEQRKIEDNIRRIERGEQVQP